MFNDLDMNLLKQSSYVILQMNYHDITIHSSVTGHDWIIVSNYERPNCYILHRHSRKYPFHRQMGHYKSLKDALNYIDQHEDWFLAQH